MSFTHVASQLSNLFFLGMVVGIPAYAQTQKINLFDSFLEGAKGGIDLIIKIIPYMVAMLVAIGMFRASGALDALGRVLEPILNRLGMPVDVLPLALVRPFSGSAANGVMADVIAQHGGNAFVSKLAATMMGSTETTFYVVAIYFGAVNIQRTRHAIPAGLFADFVGVMAAVFICRLVFL